MLVIVLEKAPTTTTKAPSPRSKSVDHQSTEIKQVKVMRSSGKRHTLAHISYQDKRNSWGGSVPAFFNTTKQELDIDDALTPGKRRQSSTAHEFEVCDSITTSSNSPGNWEDQFESRRAQKLAPRPKIGSVRVVRDLSF